MLGIRRESRRHGHGTGLTRSGHGRAGHERGASADGGGLPEPRPAITWQPIEPGADERPEIPKLPRWIPVTTLVLSLLGLADSIYLTITHFNPATLSCQVNSVVNCVKVTTSPQSEVFGVIPVALIGLGYFVVVTFVNLPFMWRSFDVRIAWARYAVALVGMGMVIYLISVELLQVKAICEYCTGVHIVTFLLFVLVAAAFGLMSTPGHVVPLVRGRRRRRRVGRARVRGRDEARRPRTSARRNRGTPAPTARAGRR